MDDLFADIVAQAAGPGNDAAVSAAILGLEPDQRADCLQDIMARAYEAGFKGWGGDCGTAAIAINQVLFGGQGQFTAAVNAFFWQHHSRLVGHVAVALDGGFWDADGQAKSWPEIGKWGVIRPGSIRYYAGEAARLAGPAFDASHAGRVQQVTFASAQECIDCWKADRSASFSLAVAVCRLREASDAWLLDMEGEKQDAPQAPWRP